MRYLTDIRIYYDGVAMVQMETQESGCVMQWRWGRRESWERRFGLELARVDFLEYYSGRWSELDDLMCIWFMHWACLAMLDERNE